MANEEVVIKIGAVDNASKVVGGLTSKLDGLHGLSNKVGSAMGTGLKVGAMAGVAGLAALGGAAAMCLKAAMDEQVGIEKLKAAVEASGESWTAQGSVIDAAIAQREKLAFADDDLRDSLSILIAQTGSSEEALKRQSLAMDLSRGTGMDLTSASKLLGKVTDENVNVLKRYGIAATEGMDATDLLAKVQQKFGGQSEAFASTAAGKWQLMTNQIGNVKEELGGALLPVATKVLGAISMFLIDNMDNCKKFGKAVYEVAEKGFSAVMPYVKDFASLIQDKVIPAVKEFWQEHGPGIVNFFKNAALWIIDFYKTLFEAYVTIAKFLAPSLDTLADLWKSALAPALAAVMPYLKQVWDFLSAHKEIVIGVAAVILLLTNPWLAVVAVLLVVLAKWDTISKLFTETIPGAIDALLDKIGEIPIIGEIFKGAFEACRIIVETVFNLIKIQVETAVNAIKDVITIVMALVKGDWEGAWNGIKDLVTGIWDGIKVYIETLLGGIRDLFFNQLETIKGIVTDAFGLIKTAITGALGEAKTWVTDKWSAVKGLITSPFDGILEKAKDLFGVKTALTDAFDAAKTFVTDNWPEIAAIISDPFFLIVAVATDAFGVRSALEGAMTALKTFVGARVTDIVGFFTGLPGRITGTIASILTAATSVGTSIKNGIVAGITGALGVVADIATGIKNAIVDVLNTLIGRLELGINWAIDKFNDIPLLGDVPLISIPRLAEGGIVRRPTLALIGERGPEAVVPLGRGGRAAMQEVHVHFDRWITGDTRQLEAIARDLMPIIRRELG